MDILVRNYVASKSTLVENHTRRRSFKATVLKLPSDNVHRELETSITPEEMSRLTRKANIAYFIAKNDMERGEFKL